ASAPRPPGPDGPAAGGLDYRPRWPGTPRRRATNLVHPRTHQRLDLTQRLALPAGSDHVRSLPATTEAPGVADCGRAQRQANGLGYRPWPRFYQTVAISFVRPIICAPWPSRWLRPMRPSR